MVLSSVASNNETILSKITVKYCLCMILVLENEVLFGGSNDQLMGLILLNFQI